jgi:hypothetical protein
MREAFDDAGSKTVGVAMNFFRNNLLEVKNQQRLSAVLGEKRGLEFL